MLEFSNARALGLKDHKKPMARSYSCSRWYTSQPSATVQASCRHPVRDCGLIWARPRRFLSRPPTLQQIQRVSAELPGGGAIALATLEPDSGGHRLQFRPELTSNQHRREVADPVPEPLGEAAGNDRPIRECDVAHRLCAEPQGPEPDGLVDHARGFRGRWWANRLSVEPELLQAGEALLVRRGSRRGRLCGSW